MPSLKVRLKWVLTCTGGGAPVQTERGTVAGNRRSLFFVRLKETVSYNCMRDSGGKGMDVSERADFESGGGSNGIWYHVMKLEEKHLEEQSRCRQEIDELRAEIRALSAGHKSSAGGGENKYHGSEIINEAFIDTASAESKNDTKEHSNESKEKDDSPKIPPACLPGLYAVLTESPINILLLFVPFALAGPAWPAIPCFVICLLAIIPLAKVMGAATEQLALYTSQTMGGLLNATFGNAVEVIIGIIAVNDNLLVVVQASMLGSILSNLLLVLGMSFVAAGINFKQSSFNSTAAQAASSMLLLAVMGLIIPAAMYLSDGGSSSTTRALSVEDAVLSCSRFTAVVLILIYVCYLVFQLKTHTELYEEGEDGEEEEAPILPLWGAIALLAATTVLVSVISEFLVGSIDQVRPAPALSPVTAAGGQNWLLPLR